MAVVPQAYRQPCLILNLLESPDKGTPSVNGAIGREFDPALMQFGRALPGIFQEIWEAYPAKVPVWVSIPYVTDAYQHSNLWTSQVGTSTYVAP